MLDDIPDAQVAAQAAPDPGGSQHELGVGAPAPAASATVALLVPFGPSDVL
ncbi:MULTISPECIES: hypothetical protein [unclassified Streptomyces]|uniref:hypothetical protein n=1 Tax=unclassified Streptomyces TaxID=2593676 RepID=UPI0013DCD7BA|nr:MULTISPECIES: hypothetical protein [unclassified Streptomyces]NMI54290.1 hypothetical protein [Streptomyces sp. RLA2-12]